MPEIVVPCLSGRPFQTLDRDSFREGGILIHVGGIIIADEVEGDSLRKKKDNDSKDKQPPKIWTQEIYSAAE